MAIDGYHRAGLKIESPVLKSFAVPRRGTNFTGQAEPSLLEPVDTASPCLVEPEPIGL